MKKILTVLLIIAILLLTFTACSQGSEQGNDLELTKESKPASEATIKVNESMYDILDFDDKSEYENSQKGLIDAPENLEIKNANGDVIWSQEAYAFLDEEECPDTVNPSLWENGVNNHSYGLFEVSDGIYQVRGYDITNLTLIEGETGWIIFDTMLSMECSQAAMELVNKNLGTKPIVGIVISHPHHDHFCGIKGLVSEDELADPTLSLDDQIKSGKIPVLVPEGFVEHASEEDIYISSALMRRTLYPFGQLLEPSSTGKVSVGIGMDQSNGTSTYLSPTYEIKKTGETCSIDGIDMEFQITLDTECAVEMNTWLPQKNALWLAENCTSTMHNLYSIRGAEVRDGNSWAKYICESINLYGEDVEVVFQSHNWPHWGNDNIIEYMENTAAAYQFINDQTLTYINQGYTSNEIANMIELPDELAANWYTRQYYGTVSHNSKAVYQKYMGWYDSNPVNLNPLSPEDSASKLMEYIDVDEALKKAKEDYDKGEYQWVAEITNKIVFADPSNEDARMLCADALEQLGYQSESSVWRNSYLSAAIELREGTVTGLSYPVVESGVDMSTATLFNYMAIALDKEALENEDFKMNFTITDTDEKFYIHVKNGVVLKYENMLADDVDVSVITTKAVLGSLLTTKIDTLEETSKIEGDRSYLELFASNLTDLSLYSTTEFNIIEP